MKEDQIKANLSKRTAGEKCELCLKFVIWIYNFPCIVGFFGAVLLVHGCTYRVLDGQIINTAGNNEIFSFIFLVIIFFLYKQKDISQDQIQDKMDQFEGKLARRTSKAASKLGDSVAGGSDAGSVAGSVGPSPLLTQLIAAARKQKDNDNVSQMSLRNLSVQSPASAANKKVDFASLFKQRNTVN